MTDTPLCATDCGRPSPHGFICPPCLTETRDLLAAVTPEQHRDLLLIARGEMQPANPNSVSDNTSGPSDVLNLVIFSLFQDLTHRWPTLLPHLQRHEDAAQHIADIQAGVELCDHLTIPAPMVTTNPKHIEARMQQLIPMQPNDLTIWFKEHLGLRITRGQIDDWRYHGLLHPTHTNKRAVYYHPADVLRARASRERQY